MQTSASALTTAASLTSPAKDGKASKVGASAFTALLNALPGRHAAKAATPEAKASAKAEKAPDPQALKAARTDVAKETAADDTETGAADASSATGAVTGTTAATIEPKIPRKSKPAGDAKPVPETAAGSPGADNSAALPVERANPAPALTKTAGDTHENIAGRRRPDGTTASIGGIALAASGKSDAAPPPALTKSEPVPGSVLTSQTASEGKISRKPSVARPDGLVPDTSGASTVSAPKTSSTTAKDVAAEAVRGKNKVAASGAVIDSSVAPEKGAAAPVVLAAAAGLTASVSDAATAMQLAAVAKSATGGGDTKSDIAVEPGSSKTRSTRLAATAKRDAADSSLEAAATAKAETKADAKSAEATPQPGAKSVDAATQPSAKLSDTASPSPPPAAGTPDAASAAGTMVSSLSDIRVPVSREAVPNTAAAAPVVAMRVHTKDGVTRSIEIRLDPPELGIVDVKLETGRDGKLTAVLSTENGDAFQMLKGESGALEAALREAGVDLGEDGITFSLNDSGAGSGSPGKRSEAYAGTSGRAEAAAEAAIANTTHGWRAGAIDISV